MLLESMSPPLELVFAWQTAQFPHGIRRGWGLVVLIGILFPISSVCVVLRSQLRIRKRRFGIDDVLIMLATLLAAGVDASIILGFRLYGYDRHVWDVTQPMALKARQMTFAIEQLNSSSTCLTKISILFFYRRLAHGTYKSKFVRIVQANILFVAAYLLVISVVLFLTCNPFEAYWMQFDIIWSHRNTYKCLNESAVIIAVTAISILQDFIACGLPSILLWELQMRKKQKILLACLLGLGILPCVAGILRLVYTIGLYSTYDSTWASYPVLICTVVETHLGILCACAPALHSYAKEVSRSRAWFSTVNLFKYLSDRSNSNNRASFYGSHGYSNASHIELCDNGGAPDSSSSAGGSNGGGGAGVKRSTAPGKKSATSQLDTLLSSTLNGIDSSRSFGSKGGEREGNLGSEGGGEGGVAAAHTFEGQRQREGEIWYLAMVPPEISPIRPPDEVPAYYLNRHLNTPAEVLASSIARGSLRGGEDDDDDIGVTITALPSAVVPLNVRRNG